MACLAEDWTPAVISDASNTMLSQRAYITCHKHV
jgi:hypothetical protein